MRPAPWWWWCCGDGRVHTHLETGGWGGGGEIRGLCDGVCACTTPKGGRPSTSASTCAFFFSFLFFFSTPAEPATGRHTRRKPLFFFSHLLRSTTLRGQHPDAVVHSRIHLISHHHHPVSRSHPHPTYHSLLSITPILLVFFFSGSVNVQRLE